LKYSLSAVLALPVVAMLCACSPDKPSIDPPRPVRTAEIHYESAHATERYAGTVQSRYEVDQSFRVAGKVAQRKVDVGQVVHEGDVIAVLDDSDYRLAEEAAQQGWTAAVSQARQADSDRLRLQALKSDGSVSASDDERANTSAATAHATAEAEARKLELARNRLLYTVLRASRSGVVTAVHFEVGQVVAEGMPVVSIADPGEPEVVVDVPEDQVSTFRMAHFKAALAGTPGDAFEVDLRELAPQAASQTRTYRARLKPASARALPLGATATLVSDRIEDGTPVAAVPSTALTQNNGLPAMWVVKQIGKESLGAVQLASVAVRGYRNDDVLVSGPADGTKVVTAGVQKMAPGLKVALSAATVAEANNPQQAAR
jgi:RND family efflux transporter MFP subunit